MACFLAPVTEAVVVTIAKKVIEKKKSKELDINPEGIQSESMEIAEASEKTSFSKKVGWLTNMLWGGSFLLLIEHVWHGEVVPWPPFLTAMGSAADTSAMLHEIATVGVGMACLVTGVWAVMLAVSHARETKNSKVVSKEEL